MVLPHRLFPGLESRNLPNNLYELYATEFGVTIARAGERLKAVAATLRTAKHLDVPSGTPLLSVDRIAFDIGGAPVEWRVSLCRTDGFHYLCDLR
jgi:GntR family transcriptional regulator